MPELGWVCGCMAAASWRLACGPAACHHLLQSFVLLKNDPPVPPKGWAAGSGHGSGCSEAQGAAVSAALPLLPLRLEGMKRITVLGPMANRTGELGCERIGAGCHLNAWPPPVHKC